MELTFILVEPAVAGNIGSSARAIKTMGFDRLVLVNSQTHFKPEARWLAHGSIDILDSIIVYDTLEEAVRDMDMVIGTTSKKRRIHADYYSCKDIFPLVKSKSDMIDNLAIVFGREESGLTNQELKLCNVFTGIPMHGSYPSLNLAQSVMIYAWEMSGFNILREESSAKTPAIGKYRRLRTKVRDMLSAIGYDENSAIFSRIMERLEAAGDKDAGLLMSVCSRLQEALKEKDEGEG